MTAPQQLVHEHGLPIPRVYAGQSDDGPVIVVGCTCGWHHVLPDGSLSILVTQYGTRHMMTDHLGITGGMVSDEALALSERIDQATRPPAGR